MHPSLCTKHDLAPLVFWQLSTNKQLVIIPVATGSVFHITSVTLKATPASATHWMCMHTAVSPEHQLNTRMTPCQLHASCVLGPSPCPEPSAGGAGSKGPWWAVFKGVWPGRVIMHKGRRGVIEHPGLQYKSTHHAATYAVSHRHRSRPHTWRLCTKTCQLASVCVHPAALAHCAPVRRDPHPQATLCPCH